MYSFAGDSLSHRSYTDTLDLHIAFIYLFIFMLLLLLSSSPWYGGAYRLNIGVVVNKNETIFLFFTFLRPFF
jgi:hypothetical protein